MQKILLPKKQKNKSPKIEIPQELTDIIIKLTEEIIDEADIKLDTIEVAMTEIFRKIREKATTQMIESKNPDKYKCSSCGELMRNKGYKPKKITGLSEYSIKRRVFYCKKCRQYEIPVNSKIECSGRYTLEVKKGMILLGQRINFEEASNFLEKFLQVKVSHETIQEYVEKIGKKIAEKEDDNIKKAFDNDGFLKEYKECLPKDKIKDTAYLLMDGSMVLTIEDKWKETRLGMIYTEKNIFKPDKNHRVITKKKYFGTYNKKEGSLIDFLQKTTYEANQFRFQDYTKQVILGDGAPYIWNYAETEHPNAIQILDYYHASEYLGSALQSIKFSSNEEKEKIKDDIFDRLNNGKIKDILQFLEKQTLTKEINDCIRYYTNNEKRMNYGQYRELGLNIGSGAIESAHKIVIQSRMKQSGMRWSTANVQSIVSLRSKYLSGEWNQIVDDYLLAA